MDTLFRLVSLQSSDHQQQSNSSFNSSRTSTTSSKSLKQNHYHRRHSNNYNHHFQTYSSQEEVDQEEECFNTTNQVYMDEDFSSSSSNPNSSTPTFSIPQNPNLPELLLECSRAFSTHDTPRIQHLMWMINELSSPYGDPDQKLASYFLQAFFAKLSNSGPRTLQTLSSASEKTMSFDSTRRIALKFQELSPWSSFGHVASNGAILEAFLEPDSLNRPLHIIDVSNTFCTQWPTLLEALATRSTEDTPHLTVTTVVTSCTQRVMKEIASRMEKFARLMGVPFRFNVVRHSGDLSTLDLDRLHVDPAATTAINLVNALRTVSPAGGRRDVFLSALHGLQPKIVTVVEEHADLSDLGEEMRWFGDAVRFYAAYFDSLEESFGKTSNERLALERQAGRGMVDLVACPTEGSKERRETGRGWARRMGMAGFRAAGFSDDVADDVRALLRRYREGWGMRGAEAGNEGGVFLEWKEQPVVWASAWRL